MLKISNLTIEIPPSCRFSFNKTVGFLKINSLIYFNVKRKSKMKVLRNDHRSPVSN